MKSKILAVILLTAVSLTARTWTSIDGRTIEGDLIAKTETTATIKRVEGSVVTIPLDKLIEADRAFVAKAAIKSVRAELQAFFNSKDWLNEEQKQASGGSGPFGGSFRQTIASKAVSWTRTFTRIEEYAQDTPDDKRLVIEIRSAIAAMKKAQMDKTQSAEAFRALTSLKNAAMK